MEKKHLLERIIGNENIVKIPLIEIAGEQRILIEHHLGILAYSLNEIEIKVPFGKVSIVGNNLQLSQLNSDQLVIHGHIDAVRLCRR